MNKLSTVSLAAALVASTPHIAEGVLDSGVRLLRHDLTSPEIAKACRTVSEAARSMLMAIYEMGIWPSPAQFRFTDESFGQCVCEKEAMEVGDSRLSAGLNIGENPQTALRRAVEDAIATTRVCMRDFGLSNSHEIPHEEILKTVMRFARPIGTEL